MVSTLPGRLKGPFYPAREAQKKLLMFCKTNPTVKPNPLSVLSVSEQPWRNVNALVGNLTVWIKMFFPTHMN